MREAPPTSERLSEEKERALEAVRSRIEDVTDRLGKPIEEGIREAVVLLNVLDIATQQSCEGHEDESDGLPFPWIDIAAPGRPRERYVGQANVYEETAQAHGIPVERLWNPETDVDERAAEEALQRVEENDETAAYAAWRRVNDDLLARGRLLVEEFNAIHSSTTKPTLRVAPLAESARLFSGPIEYPRGGTIPQEDQEALVTELPHSRAEMRAFADFLKQKFSES